MWILDMWSVKISTLIATIYLKGLLRRKGLKWTSGKSSVLANDVLD
jgi:hypothetical protein